MERKAKHFEFVEYRLKDKRNIELEYAVVFEDESRLQFIEKITLPAPALMEQPELKEVFDKTLQTLHLMCGLSYYKTYCPKEILLRNYNLAKDQAVFWDEVFTKGLGEFFYRNKIDFRGLVNFPYGVGNLHPAPSLPRKNRALVAVGGGKDSIVTHELLKKSQIETSAFLMETQKEYPLVNNIVQEMNIEALHIQRTIDPKLFGPSIMKGAYNGHIPITALYSVVGLLCAVLYDYKYVIMSNEKSANYGNVMYNGIEINHQWSKSIEFETLFQSYIHTFITKDIQYFSLLRGWSEMRVVEEFVKYPQYFPLFSSCNKNFKVNEQGLTMSRWCGECPKCAFVFSMLAAFLPKSQVVQILGSNLYAAEKMIPLFQELLGVKDYKPFECVGTPEEVTAAFYKAHLRGEFDGDIVMKMFKTEVLPTVQDPQALIDTVLKVDRAPLVPVEFNVLIKN